MGSETVEKFKKLYAARQQVQESIPERQLYAKAAVAAEPDEHVQNVSDFGQSFVHGLSDGLDERASAAGAVGMGTLKGKPANYDAELKRAADQRVEREGRSPLLSTAGNIAGSVLSPVNKIKALAPLVQGARAGLMSFNEADPDKPLSDRLLDAGSQAAQGAALTAVAGKVTKKLFGAQAEGRANDAAIKATGGSGKVLQEMDEALPAAKGLGTGRAQVGQYIQDNKLVKAGDTIEKVQARIQQHADSVGKQMETVLADLDAKGFPVNTEKVIKRIYSAAVRVAGKERANIDQVKAALEPKLRAFADQFVTGPSAANSPAKFTDLHAFQSSLARAFEGAVGTTTAAKEALQSMKIAIMGAIKQEAQDAALRLNKQVPGEFNNIVSNYQKAALALKSADAGLKGHYNKLATKASNLTGRWGPAAAVGAWAMGHPVAAGIIGASSVAAKGAPYYRSTAAALLNKAVDMSPELSKGAKGGILEILRLGNGQ